MTPVHAADDAKWLRSAGNRERDPPRVVVLMGVAGAGKSTVGEALARQTGWTFLDADDFHSAENRARMAAGRPLRDEDRTPWLEALNAALREATRVAERPVVLACSALADRYRAILVRGLERVTFVHLHVAPELARSRVRVRRHFFGAGLVDDQYERLEIPNDAIIVDASRAVHEIVAELRDRIPFGS